MKVIETHLKDLVILEPKVYEDERGYFFESYSKKNMPAAISNSHWVQDNESKSKKGVLRGLHFQIGNKAQAKLIRVVIGEIYDVAVDIRPESKTYGEWFGAYINAENKRQMYIPRGFAHGFLVLSDEAIFIYKCDNLYAREAEGGIIYNDPSLEIEWPIDPALISISEKDKFLPFFKDLKKQ